MIVFRETETLVGGLFTTPKHIVTNIKVVILEQTNLNADGNLRAFNVITLWIELVQWNFSLAHQLTYQYQNVYVFNYCSLWVVTVNKVIITI